MERGEEVKEPFEEQKKEENVVPLLSYYRDMINKCNVGVIMLSLEVVGLCVGVAILVLFLYYISV